MRVLFLESHNIGTEPTLYVEHSNCYGIRTPVTFTTDQTILSGWLSCQFFTANHSIHQDRWWDSYRHPHLHLHPYSPHPHLQSYPHYQCHPLFHLYTLVVGEVLEIFLVSEGGDDPWCEKIQPLLIRARCLLPLICLQTDNV